MSARIFISYRTADGMDKAVALARDLGRRFGDAQVFLDKDDLRGGSSWREEIGRTLEARPVLLLLLTPQLIEAVGADGRLRIADPQDPVRRELQAAMEVGAQVIPLLCDGLSAPPDASKLPEPFNRIGELTWRKLRAYDWAHDVERIVADLQAFGIALPVASAAPASAVPRRAMAAGVGLLALGVAVWWWQKTGAASREAPAPVASTPAATTPAPSSAPPAAAPSSPAIAAASAAASSPGAKPAAGGISGRWAARLSRGEQTTLVLTQAGNRITLASEPIAIATRPDWAEYRAFWRERFGRDLNAVMYRGEGLMFSDPGVPPRIDVALKVHPSHDTGEPVDSGNLSAALSADGRTLSGTIWINSLQAEQPATLKRKP